MRREFIKLAGAAALNLARPADARTKTDLPLIGMLFHGREDLLKDRLAGLRLALQQAGFIEGKNYSLAISSGCDALRD
jgi:putative tryptophan/tyrosine transport system substrate-binding protein